MGTVDNVKRKGLDTTLHIFKKLLEFNPNFKLYIIGTLGEGKIYLDELINLLKLSDHIFFTGPIDEYQKSTILNKSKYYFQISKYEGFGIAVVEAMYFKNFIIHTNKGGLKDTIQDNGLIFNESLTYDEFSNEFMNIDNQLESYSFLLEKNKKHVIDKFSLTQRAINLKLLINNE